MADRREFLQYAIASTLPLGATAALGTEPAARSLPSAIRHVVIDSRHREGPAFAAVLAARGAAPHRLADGDVTGLWLRTLGPAWREAPVAVAGLTRLPALFVLEQLAFAHGLRVVHHVEHVVRACGTATHAVVRRAADAGAAGVCARPGTAWPKSVADEVANFSATSSGGARPGPTVAGLLPVVPDGAELLASWIIAPV